MGGREGGKEERKKGGTEGEEEEEGGGGVGEEGEPLANFQTLWGTTSLISLRKMSFMLWFTYWFCLSHRRY